MRGGFKPNLGLPQGTSLGPVVLLCINRIINILSTV